MFFAFGLMLSGNNALIDPQRGSGASLLLSCRATIRLVDTPKKAAPSVQDGLAGQYCLGYTDGFIAFLVNVPNSGICMETQNRLLFIRRYVVWMTEHPEAMAAPKDWGLLQAMKDMYPCVQK